MGKRVFSGQINVYWTVTCLLPMFPQASPAVRRVGQMCPPTHPDLEVTDA